MEVTACLVTRGDVDLTEILDSFPPEWGVVVWDNSKETDLAVEGRYAAINRALTDVVYTQDDDCVLERDSLLALAEHYQTGVLTANMPAEFRPHYRDSCLIGFGAIFDQDLPDLSFGRLTERPSMFERTCDVYFTALAEHLQLVDVPKRNLPWATADDRMYRELDHYGSRTAALLHARALRGD